MLLDEGDRPVGITGSLVIFHWMVEFDTVLQEDDFLRLTVPLRTFFAELRQAVVRAVTAKSLHDFEPFPR